MWQRAARLLIAAALLSMTACSTKPAAADRSMSLDEVYSITDRVNETAKPYPLGTGDGLGRQTYSVYRAHQRMMAAQDEQE